MSDLWPGLNGPAIRYISEAPSEAWRRGVRQLVLLGSTGSIGGNTLAAIRSRRRECVVLGLSCARNIKTLAEQAQEFRPPYLAVLDEASAAGLRKLLPTGYTPEILVGSEGYARLAALPEADTVLSAQVGAAGLAGTLAAALAGKVICLANKESLVLAGDMLRQVCARTHASILPVDSEHNAIFQCLAGRGQEVDRLLLTVDSEHSAIFQCLQDQHSAKTLEKILLTASGGPFRGRSREELRNVTRAQALDHPNWKMGAKISIDSATMMNKALEVVEAFHLYGVPLEKITVLVHPQSLVHSLVQFTDGSQLAQLGTPDMRIPIAACLFWPRCVDTGVPPLDLVKAGTLQFFAPDDEAFPALKLARRALRERGGMSVVMNAANEAAVELFLSGKCAFADIADLVSAAMDAHAAGEPGHEPFCPPLSCSGDDSLALEREVTILTERMSRLDLKTRELVKQLARAGVDEC